MKRHLAASAVRVVGTRNESTAKGGVPNGTHSAFDNSGHARTRAASSKPTLALAPEKTWTHTLILTGELNRRSAHTLEAEIERLCEEGVTGITLDLSELSNIDATGVAVIAFRSGLCKRRGYDFALIPGSRLVHRAFERAGVSDFLPFREPEEEGSTVAKPASPPERATSAQ
jgi:anti-anti-sigma factor